MKLGKISTITTAFFALAMWAPALGAATTTEVGPDKNKALHYTCRLPNGDMVVTTESDAAQSPSAKKASIFMDKTRYEPVDLSRISPKEAGTSEKQELEFLEQVLVEKLAEEVKGWELDTARTLRVEAQAQEHLPLEERKIRLARVKTHPKKIRYARVDFTRMTAAEPAVDEPVILQPEIRGRVISVGEDEVVVTFTPAANRPAQGPFGPVTVSDQGDHYRIEIDAREGRLVRVGPMVGRIAQVEENFFEVDYSHPFGGETLVCDVTVSEGTVDPSHWRSAGSLPDTKKEAPSLRPADPPSQKEDAGKAVFVKEEKGSIVQNGDLVEVDYTASLKTGEVIWTTQSAVAEDPNMEKVSWYKAQQNYAPETIVAGQKASFPGIGDTVLGLGLGDTKRMTLPPEKAFGQRNMQLLKRFDRVKTMPRKVTIPAKEYVERYGVFPVKDKAVAFNPYVNGRVVEVNEGGAVLELEPTAEETESEFGVTRAVLKGDTIEMTLTPKMHAPFEVKKQRGRIVASDEKKFTVDFNSPLAGEEIVLDLEVVSVIKRSHFENTKITWIEDHERGLEEAANQKKPAVLVLYAPW
jgi:FKBP-type peptidyl-prolyl cis-trans isomerase 2